MNKAIKAFYDINGNNSAKDAVVNYQGGRGYELTLEEKVVSMARLGLISNTYYENERLIIERSMNTLEEAVATMPELVMQEAIIGRNEYQMKFMPVLFLAYLSTLPDSSYFNNAFGKVILTAKDLHVFLDLIRKGGIRKGTSRKIRRAINEWLETRLTEKMATRNKNILKDVIMCSHPNPSKIQGNEIFDAALKYIIKGDLVLDRAVALKKVLNSLSKGELSNDVLEQIDAFRLELEELKSAIGFLNIEDKRKVYEHFIPNFRYAGLISNLVNIERVFNHNVPESIIKIVADKLGNIEDYRNSKILPFALITARTMTKVPEWQTALDYMIQNAVPSSFDIKDRIMVVVDTSGSMTWTNITRSLTAVKAASTFGAVITLSNPDKVDLYVVANRCLKIPVKEGITPFQLANVIQQTNAGGGTYFETIMPKYDGQKYVILLTDSEQADNFEYRWRKAQKPEGAKVIVWQLTGYPHKISNRSDTIYLYGYSLTLLNVIKNILEGK